MTKRSDKTWKNFRHCWWWECSSATGGDCLTCGRAPLMYTTKPSPPSELLTTCSTRGLLVAHLASLYNNERKSSSLCLLTCREQAVRKVQPDNVANDSSKRQHIHIHVTHWLSSSIILATLIKFITFCSLVLWRDTMMRFCSRLFECNADMPSTVACQQGRADISFSWGDKPSCTPKTSRPSQPYSLTLESDFQGTSLSKVQTVT